MLKKSNISLHLHALYYEWQKEERCKILYYYHHGTQYGCTWKTWHLVYWSN